MAARDQPRSHSSRRDGGVCWSGGLALVGGKVEREVLFLPVVLRRWHPPSLRPRSIPILQASHVPAGAIAIASFPALVRIAAVYIVSSAWG